MGCAVFASNAANTASSTAASTSSHQTPAVDQPSSFARMSAYVAQAAVAVKLAMPPMSTLPRAGA